MQAELPLPKEPACFRPECLSRRGEFFAWTAAVLAGAAWVLLALSPSPVNFLAPFLTILLLLSALAISLGNWMDRRTTLFLNDQGVEFNNGLRRVSLAWQEIKTVEVFDSHLGQKVHVQGQTAFFDFRTFSEVRLRGEVKGRLGFRQGEMILKTILERAALRQVEKPGAGDYYARE